MAILLILLGAFFLRLINLSQSLWLDEAVQAITAQKSFGYIFQEITGDFHPPLYYFLMHFWVRFFGSSEIALRLPSVLFGVGTVFVLYKLAMHMHSRFVAVLAAVLLATGPFHIYYSQEARMYSMATFFSSLSMYYFLKINEYKKYKLLYFVSTLLMVYADYYGFLIILAQEVYLLLKKQYKFLLITYCLLLIAYLPWLPQFLLQLKTGLEATKNLPGWGHLANLSFLKALPLTLVKFTIGRITIFDKRIYGLVTAGILGGLGVLGSRVIKKEKIISLWFGLPIIVAWLLSLFVPNYQPFRLLLVLPAFYLMVALGIFSIKHSLWRDLLIIGVLIINIISLGVYYFNPYFQREDWRGVVKYIKEQTDAITILPSETSAWPVKYYDPTNQCHLMTPGRGVNEIIEVEKIKGDEIFYIRYLVPLFDPQEKILAKLQEEGYTKTKETSFNQIPLWEFQK